MTVCIACLSESEQQISFVTDSKAAFGDFSADKGAIKHEHLGNGHVVLISGNDVVFALSVINGAKKEIVRSKIRSTDETAEVLYSELCTARERLIESRILRRYGMTVQQFVDKGKKSFTDQVYYDICAKIDRVELSLQFLLAGFDENRIPHLRVLSVDEPPQNFDSIGFAAIGSGAPAALASLSFATDHLGFGRYSNVHECAFHLLSAKFMAESATDVGKDTFFLSVGKQGNFLLHHMGMSAFRQAWEKYAAPRQPAAATRILKDILCESDTHLDRQVLERCIKYGSKGEKKFYGILLNAVKRKELIEKAAIKLSDSQKSETTRPGTSNGGTLG